MFRDTHKTPMNPFYCFFPVYNKNINDLFEVTSPQKVKTLKTVFVVFADFGVVTTSVGVASAVSWTQELAVDGYDTVLDIRTHL